MWLLSAVSALALCKVLAYLQIVDVAGVSGMSWWWLLVGYGLSMAWFVYADRSGLTSRKALTRMEAQKEKRLQKQRECLGMQRKH